MSRRRSEGGSTLVLLIGIVAALAILATSLVVLTTNVLSNTSRDRSRAKAFNVTEAAIDHGLFVIGTNWPTKESPVAPLATADFSEFSASEYPGLSVKAVFYDNSDTGGPSGAAVKDQKINKYDANYDANGDGYMYVEAQGKVGPKSARIRALAQRSILDLELPRGVAFYTSGQLALNGGGIAIGVEIPPPGTDNASVYAGQGVTSDGSTSLSVAVSPPIENDDVPALGQLWPDALKDALRETAMNQDRYFDDAMAAANGYKDAQAMAQAKTGMEGLVFIASSTSVKFAGNTVFNGDNGATIDPATGLAKYPKPPGILFVDAPDLEINGTLHYFGLVYCSGKVTFVGNPHIHGILLAEGVNMSTKLGGSEALLYNDAVWMKLSNMVTIGSKLVPNTWQELPASASF
jgi:hypothetical protein